MATWGDLQHAYNRYLGSGQIPYPRHGLPHRAITREINRWARLNEGEFGQEYPEAEARAHDLAIEYAGRPIVQDWFGPFANAKLALAFIAASKLLHYKIGQQRRHYGDVEIWKSGPTPVYGDLPVPPITPPTPPPSPVPGGGSIEIHRRRYKRRYKRGVYYTPKRFGFGS